MKTRLSSTTMVLALLALLGSLHTASAYYDPGVQRWINRDPLSDDGSMAHAAAAIAPWIKPRSVAETEAIIEQVNNPLATLSRVNVNLYAALADAERGGVNMFRFVANNPVQCVDPTGLYPWRPDDPRYQSPPGLKECSKIEGFYRHCVATCRLNRSLITLLGPLFSLAPVATYLIAIEAGGDWPADDHGDPNHASDRAADRVGILNSYLPGFCAASCLKDTKKAIADNCTPCQK